MGFYYEFFFEKKSRIGRGGCTQNQIPRTTTVTEFSKTFLVFYEWPDPTDVQGIVRSAVGVYYVYTRAVRLCVYSIFSTREHYFPVIASTALEKI